MLVLPTALSLLALYTVPTSSTVKVPETKYEVYDVKSMLNGPMSVDEYGNVIMKITVIPDFKHDGLLDVNAKRIKLKLRVPNVPMGLDPSVDRNLNSPLKNYLSLILGVSIDDVSVIQGRKSKDKTVSISGYNQDVESYAKKFLDLLRIERNHKSKILNRLYNFILSKFRLRNSHKKKYVQ